MTNLKIKVFSFLFIIMFSSVLVACSSDQESSDTEGEGIVIRLGHASNDVESDPYHSYTEKFSEVLEEETNGRITLKVFPNSQLGDLSSMMQQTEQGDLEMTAGQNGGLLTSYYPNIQVIDMPYAFESLEVGRSVLNGSFGNELKAGVGENSGLKLLSFIPSAFRHFISNEEPIHSPKDLEGLTMRTMEVPVHQEMMKALGANPTVIAFNELYSAAQTGVVDGFESPPYVLLMNNLQEVAKYYSLDKHTLNTALTMINEEFFNSLSESDQEVILKADSEATKALLAHVDENTEKDLQTIKEAGVEIIEITPEQFGEFQDVVVGPVTKYLENEVDKEMIDKMFKAIENAK